MESSTYGNIQSCCLNKCYHGPQTVYLSLTLLLIIIPSGINHGLIYAYFHEMTMIITSQIVCGINLMISFYFLFRTSFTDPGMLPRNTYSNTQRTITNIQGKKYTLKICQTCKISRPLRSFHCDICDSCIQEHDHHCPWIGICIGLRNRKLFTSMLLSILILLLSNSIFITLRIVEICRKPRENDKRWMLILDIISLIYCIIMLLSIIGLLVPQCYTISKGMTTNEYLRGKWEDKSNPFDVGCTQNWAMFCFSSKGTDIATKYKGFRDPRKFSGNRSFKLRGGKGKRGSINDSARTTQSFRMQV